MKKISFVALIILLYIVGLLWWWPLCAAAVVWSAIVAPPAGIVLGILLDILWGAPGGALHVLYFPFTLLACVVALVSYLSPRFFFSRGSDTL